MACSNRSFTGTESVHLSYEAPDLLGVMTAGDITGVLAGLCGLYAQLCGFERGALEKSIHIAAVEQGVVRIALDLTARDTEGDTSSQIGLAHCMFTSTSDLGRIVGAKKHLAGIDPAKAEVCETGSLLLLFNCDKESYEVTKRQFELLTGGVLDSDLAKITAPVAKGRAETLKICLGEHVVEKIVATEGVIFELSPATTGVGQHEAWLEGRLNSLTKSGYRGIFYTRLGDRLRYRFIGKNPDSLLQAFAHRGNVWVRCKAKSGARGTPVLMLTDVQATPPIL